MSDSRLRFGILQRPVCLQKANRAANISLLVRPCMPWYGVLCSAVRHHRLLHGISPFSFCCVWYGIPGIYIGYLRPNVERVLRMPGKCDR